MAVHHRTLASDAATREAIKTPELVELLQNHCFGLVDLDKTKVTAALGLLKKSLPDIRIIDVSIAEPILLEVLMVSERRQKKARTRTVKKPAKPPDHGTRKNTK